jgi:hypothetical protein
METILIIIVSILIGYAIGNSKSSIIREQFEREQDRIDAEFKARHVRNGRISCERELLLKEREGYLRYVVELNDKCRRESGQIYQNVDKAMEEYDNRHASDWYKTGMVPPTYANKIYYYKEKNKYSAWIK